MDIEQLADVLKALADPTRLQILALLRSRDCCVCELVAVFDISQPAVSKHLGRLKASGLVQETRRGQWVFYALREARLAEAGLALANLPDLSDKLRELERKGLSAQCR